MLFVNKASETFHTDFFSEVIRYYSKNKMVAAIF